MKTVATVFFCALFPWAACATETENQPDKVRTPTTSHIEQLLPPTPNAKQLCTADRQWCLSLNSKVGNGEVIVRAFVVRTPRATQTYHLSDPAVDQPDSGVVEEGVAFDSQPKKVELWPMRIVSASGNVLVGMFVSENTIYSGGGAGVIALGLSRLDASGKAEPVLALPWHSWAMIRSCFSERDYRQRRGACHDEYSYTAKLSVMAQNVSGFPVLRYQSVATSFPGHVSRMADSTAQGRLRAADLKTVVNRACSLTREVRYSPRLKAYALNHPLPECADYFKLYPDD